MSTAARAGGWWKPALSVTAHWFSPGGGPCLCGRYARPRGIGGELAPERPEGRRKACWQCDEARRRATGDVTQRTVYRHKRAQRASVEPRTLGRCPHGFRVLGTGGVYRCALCLDGGATTLAAHTPPAAATTAPGGAGGGATLPTPQGGTRG